MILINTVQTQIYKYKCTNYNLKYTNYIVFVIFQIKLIYIVRVYFLCVSFFFIFFLQILANIYFARRCLDGCLDEFVTKAAICHVV